MTGGRRGGAEAEWWRNCARATLRPSAISWKLQVASRRQLARGHLHRTNSAAQSPIQGAQVQYVCSKATAMSVHILIVVGPFRHLPIPSSSTRNTRPNIMISDNQLYTLAIFLGSASMLLIVLYHFLEVNSEDHTAAEKSKVAPLKAKSHS